MTVTASVRVSASALFVGVAVMVAAVVAATVRVAVIAASVRVTVAAVVEDVDADQVDDEAEDGHRLETGKQLWSLVRQMASHKEVKDIIETNTLLKYWLILASILAHR